MPRHARFPFAVLPFAPVSLAAVLALSGVHCSSSDDTGGSDDIPQMAYTGAGGNKAAGAGGAGGAAGSSSSAGSSSVSSGGTDSGGSAGANTFDVTVRSVAPADTDPDITHYLEPHGVMLRDPLPDPKLTPRPLFVHLSRTNGLPLDATTYLKHAALAGHHVIDLRYPNDMSITELCADDADAACSEKIHAEIFDGTDHSPKVEIAKADSVLNRLVKLLEYLDTKYPNEGWATYLMPDHGEPYWGLDTTDAKNIHYGVTLSGHSLGAGEAAYIAKQRSVTHEIFFAGPEDGTDSAAADWLNATGKTPATVQFAFVHQQDAAFTRIHNAWIALGVSGSATLATVDGPPASWTSAQSVMSAKVDLGGADPHDVVLLDAATPMLNGLPVYGDVWDHLIGPN